MSIWVVLGIVSLIALIVLLSVYFYKITRCPKCGNKMKFTAVGMGICGIGPARYVCFNCSYEQQIVGCKPTPEWVAWRNGFNYYMRPHFVQNGVIRWERVQFDTAEFDNIKSAKA